MAALESARQAVVPLLVVTVIAAGLVADYGSHPLAGPRVALDGVPVSTFEDGPEDRHLPRMCLPDTESRDPELILLVYRVPAFREYFGYPAGEVLLHRSRAAAKRLVPTGSRCLQAMIPGDSSTTWWM
jgi:hypothetical protein